MCSGEYLLFFMNICPFLRNFTLLKIHIMDSLVLWEQITGSGTYYFLHHHLIFNPEIAQKLL